MHDKLWFNLPLMQTASRKTSHKMKMEAIAESLCHFLINNRLTSVAYFDENGKLRPDVVVVGGDLTELGNRILQECFYKWLGFTDRGGNPNDVSILQTTLRKLSQGNSDWAKSQRQKSPRVKTLPSESMARDESSEFAIYDKADWHFNGEFPDDLDEHQVYVIGGFLLGWLCDRGLLSEEIKQDFAEDCEQYLKRKMLPAELYEVMDGSLTSDTTSPAVRGFLDEYMSLKTRCPYLADFEKTLAGGLPTVYHVQDTWENLARIEEVIDRAFAEWKRRNSGKSA